VASGIAANHTPRSSGAKRESALPDTVPSHGRHLNAESRLQKCSLLLIAVVMHARSLARLEKAPGLGMTPPGMRTPKSKLHAAPAALTLLLLKPQ
jgi:hypothetical protein